MDQVWRLRNEWRVDHGPCDVRRIVGPGGHTEYVHTVGDYIGHTADQEDNVEGDEARTANQEGILNDYVERTADQGGTVKDYVEHTVEDYVGHTADQEGKVVGVCYAHCGQGGHSEGLC